ncbi:MAG TPA: methyltransferase domain-containing protein [Candidatus Acidoferrales bacterium]|nr:methyltransferase domain-containing protein [Candidatus Acidoferrales bacterium]
MEIRDWDKRYRLREHAASDFEAGPTPLLMETAARLPPGQALDLASGPGRNAMWLAEHGWSVTAVDGAPAAIETLQLRASERGQQKITGVIADLERDEFEIQPSSWNLIAICYYLQRNLFEPAKRGVVPGGVLISIVHMNEPGEADGPFRLRPGEHEKYFAGWEILHLREGKAIDPAHRRAVSEIVARRPNAVL